MCYIRTGQYVERKPAIPAGDFENVCFHAMMGVFWVGRGGGVSFTASVRLDKNEERVIHRTSRT